jgi:sec-independent protein translocase protein TatB
MAAPLEVDLGILGWSDSLILMVLALVVFGPRRLPQIGRQIGKLMYEFRKASNDFKFQMEEELRASEEADRRKKEEERLRALAAQAPPPANLPAPATEATPAPATPYSEDVVYPPGSPAAEAPIAAAEPAAEEGAPRIQPPSTGEQVAAGAPFKSGAESLHDSGGQNGSGPHAETDAPPAADADRERDATLAQAGGHQPVTGQAAPHG